MRLSKTRKKIIKDHQNMKPSGKELKELRIKRKKILREKFNVIIDTTERVNPKKDKSARRQRKSDNGSELVRRVVKYVSLSKYKPAPFTTKKTRAA